MPSSILRPILIGTLLAGTLDILAAIGLTLFRAGDPLTMLRGVASGPFPPATGWGTAGAVLGLAVHFTLMAVMVAVFVVAGARLRQLWQRPVLWGILYGLATFVVMNLAVMPLRFHKWPTPTAVATQLFCHIVLVGIPIALVTAKHFRSRSAFA